MEALASWHPQIVHTPIVAIVVSLLFDLAGRALDRDWLRRAGMVLLVLGVLGAGAAVLSGDGAEHAAEKQGVPREAIAQHENAGKVTLWLGVATVIARAATGALPAVRPALAVLAVLLHVWTATSVVIAAHRGGRLVFDHGAGVRTEARRHEAR